MAVITKFSTLAVNKLVIRGQEIDPVEAPSHISEDKPSNEDLAIAHNELIEALKSAGVFLPDGVTEADVEAAVEADEK